jgi:hypothetical protein
MIDLQLWHYARDDGVGSFEDFSYNLPDVDEDRLAEKSSSTSFKSAYSPSRPPFVAGSLRHNQRPMAAG